MDSARLPLAKVLEEVRLAAKQCILGLEPLPPPKTWHHGSSDEVLRSDCKEMTGEIVSVLELVYLLLCGGRVGEDVGNILQQRHGTPLLPRDRVADQFTFAGLLGLIQVCWDVLDGRLEWGVEEAAVKLQLFIGLYFLSATTCHGCRPDAGVLDY